MKRKIAKAIWKLLLLFKKEKLLFCFSFSVEIATMFKLFITGKLAFSALKRLKREIEKSKKRHNWKITANLYIFLDLLLFS